MADVKQEIQNAIEKIQKAFYAVANNRQSTVVAALVARRRGAVVDSTFLIQFSNARAALLEAAFALDEQLDIIERSDRQSWLKIVGAFNEYAKKIPGVNISSPSVMEVIDLAIPPLPDSLFQPRESAQSARDALIETKRYEARPGSGLNGVPNQLGFFQPLIGAATGSTCLAAAAAAGVVTAGVGAAVVGAGCLLLAIGAIVATTAIAIYLVKRLPTSAATALAAADSLKSATDQISSICKERNLSSKDCAEMQKKALENTDPPNSLLDIPWTAVAAGVGAIAVWFFWPTILAAIRAKRGQQVAQPVSGMRSRSKRRVRRHYRHA